MRTSIALAFTTACITAEPDVLLLVGGLLAVVCLAVVMPAVWSTSPARRKAAMTVLVLARATRSQEGTSGTRHPLIALRAKSVGGLACPEATANQSRAAIANQPPATTPE